MVSSNNNNGNIPKLMTFWLIAVTLAVTVHGYSTSGFFRVGTLQTQQGTELGQQQELEGAKSSSIKYQDSSNLEDHANFKRIVPKVNGESKDPTGLENKEKSEQVNVKEDLPLADSGNLKNQNGDENSNLGVKKLQEIPRRAESNPETAKDKAKEEKKLDAEIKTLVNKNEPLVSKAAGEPELPKETGGDDHKMSIPEFNQVLHKAVEGAATPEEKEKYLKLIEDVVNRYHLILAKKERVEKGPELAKDRKESIQLEKDDKTLKKDMAEAGGKMVGEDKADTSGNPVKESVERLQKITMEPRVVVGGEARGGADNQMNMNANNANGIVIDGGQSAPAAINLADNQEHPENAADGTAQNANISAVEPAPLPAVDKAPATVIPDKTSAAEREAVLEEKKGVGAEKNIKNKNDQKQQQQQQKEPKNVSDVKGVLNEANQQKISTPKSIISAQASSGSAGTVSSSDTNANKSNPLSIDKQKDNGTAKPSKLSTNGKSNDNVNAVNSKLISVESKKQSKSDDKNIANKKRDDPKSNGNNGDKNGTNKKTNDNKRTLSAPTTVVEKKDDKPKAKDKVKAEKVKKIKSKSNAGPDISEDSADSADADDDAMDGKNIKASKTLRAWNGKATVSRVASGR